VTQLLARIMLALLMLPLASLVYLVLFAFLEDSRGLRLSDEEAFLAAGIASGLFVVVYWVLLWRRTVRWTGWRVATTAGVAVVSFALGLMLGSIVAEMIIDELGIFIGTVTAVLLWLVGTVFLWRETAGERAARFGTGVEASRAITCPRCGYNLTGLQSTQCPECGSRFTLDELLATRRVDGDLKANGERGGTP